MVLHKWKQCIACLGLLGAASLPRNAAACGGLFCDGSNPVNQAAERIIFAKGAEDRVTAIIEIQYEGPSERFAWVLPVPAGEVEVGLSSKQALETLQQRTNPDYRLNNIFEECDDDDDDGSDDDTADDLNDGETPDDDSVEVDVDVDASVRQVPMTTSSFP